MDAAAGSKTASKTEIKPLAFTRYELKAVIVHLGKSVHNGHYVSYVRKGGKWVLFNDETVTIRKNPMLGKGYVYVY